MATYDSVVICKFAGKDIPDALLTAVLKDHKSCAGVAIIGANEDYLGTFLMSDQSDGYEACTTESVQHLLSQHSDKCAVLSFGNFPKKYDDDNVQPYVVLFDEEGQTTMSCYMAGSYDKKAKAGTDKSPPYQVFERLILPQMLKASKANGDDISQTYKDVASDPALAELMKLMYEGEGLITLVCNEGLVTFGELAKGEDWGWASDFCGWKAVAEPVKPAGKSSNPLSFKKPEGLAAEKPTATASVSLPGATNAKPATAATEDFDWAAPPSGWTKEQKRRWYLEYNIIDGKGVVPDGYKNCPKVKVAKAQIAGATAIKDLKDIPKDKLAATSSNGQVTSTVLPVISPKGKEYVKNVFVKQGHVQKTISEGKVIFDPKRAKELEADWATFTEAGGLDDIRQTLGMSDEERADIIAKAPDAAAVLLKDTQYAYYKLLEELGRLDLKIAVPQEEPAPQRVAAGGKKNALSFKK